MPCNWIQYAICPRSKEAASALSVHPNPWSLKSLGCHHQANHIPCVSLLAHFAAKCTSIAHLQDSLASGHSILSEHFVGEGSGVPQEEHGKGIEAALAAHVLVAHGCAQAIPLRVVRPWPGIALGGLRPRVKHQVRVFFSFQAKIMIVCFLFYSGACTFCVVS